MLPTGLTPQGFPASTSMSPPSISLSAKESDLDGSQLAITLVPSDDIPPETNRKSLRFVLIFSAICLSVLLSAVEITAVATALPTIVSDLRGNDFVWIGSAYALSSTALLPASGALAEIFGRRDTMLLSLGIFALGSALCGAAENMSWLIAARTVQGAGGGAIQALASIIISDLVSLKERGVYNSVVGLTWGMACTIGPLVGGVLAERGQWRWIFYMNLPIAALAAGLVFFFLNLRKPEGTLKDKLARMDWIGNTLIIASSSACIIGLTWGGIQYAWSSVHVVIPLIIGILGIGAFLYYEARFAKYPMAPLSLISNRTTISGYVQVFILPIVNLAVIYYQLMYYQACQGASPIRAGVLALAVTIALAPSMIICGLSITMSKTYRVQLWLGWVILLIGMGAMSTLESTTKIIKPIIYTALVGTGDGILYAGTYFPVLAPLPISENAHALSFFIFCRSFATVWGVTIGGAVLQNQLIKLLPAEFLSQLPEGVSVAFSAIPTINGLSEPLRSQVQQAFAGSTAVIWQVMIGIAGIGFISSFFMKAFLLHTQVDEKWGLEEKQSRERENNNA